MDLMARRRMMMAKKALPYDAQVEYLESSGTQYIETTFKAGDVDRVVGEVEFSELSSSVLNYVVGVRELSASSSKANGFSLYSRSHNGFNFYPMKWVDSAGVTIAVGQKVSFDTTIMDGLQEFVVDGVTLYRDTLSKTITPGNNKMTIFALKGDSSVSYQSKAKIYGNLILYSSGEAVANFIPVRVGQVGYLYDKVSGSLFGNSGTGDFILGNDITT